MSQAASKTPLYHFFFLSFVRSHEPCSLVITETPVFILRWCLDRTQREGGAGDLHVLGETVAKTV